MEGLLRRLSDGETEAEDALRVVLFFDRLVASRAGVADLLTSAARLIGGTAGYAPAAAPVHEALAFDELGVALSAPTVRGRARAVDPRQPPLGDVWIDAADLPLADLVLERLAIAAGIVLARIGAAPPILDADPVLQLIHGDADDPTGLAAAARALRLRPEWEVQVLACWSPAQQAETQASLTEWAAGEAIRRAPFAIDGDLVVGLLRSDDVFDAATLPEQVLAATGPRRNVLDAAASYAGARQALRLTSLQLGPRFLEHDALGPLVHLASLRPEDAASTELVRALRFLLHTPAGLAELEALDAFCRLGGVRAAATAMHMHHSSLAHRLRNAERRLSISLNEPRMRLQVTIALQLLRAAQWAGETEAMSARSASPQER